MQRAKLIRLGPFFLPENFSSWLLALGPLPLVPCFDGITRALPSCQSTEQCRCVIVSFGFEFEHRPGARMFGWSSTVSRDQLAFRQ